ncbi:hypothetical protein J2X10_002407 [Pseudomonas peli]|nr:hypothetical protein [Pseudomonas peli]
MSLRIFGLHLLRWLRLGYWLSGQPKQLKHAEQHDVHTLVSRFGASGDALAKKPQFKGMDQQNKSPSAVQQQRKGLCKGLQQVCQYNTPE